MSAQSPSRQTLEETPARVLIFLRGVGTTAVIRTALAARGYTAEDHAEGWERLHRVAGYGDGKNVSLENEAQNAIATIDAWDEPTFRVCRAALERLHPEQAAFVFKDLESATGALAVISVSMFLERLDALENGPERKSTRRADHAALATLAKRGITKEERAKMQQLIETAKGLAPEAQLDPSAEARQADLIALRAWYEDWSETARAVITRRDHLIRLGLAKRKKAAKRSPGEEGSKDETTG